MTYVVTDKCINCKLKDCVEVCPVDCFHEGENTLVIDPVACIDCGVCEVECPIGAIKSDQDPEGAKWVEMNAEYAKKWPVITENGDPMPDHEKWAEVENKYPKYFSPNPAKRDSE